VTLPNDQLARLITALDDIDGAAGDNVERSLEIQRRAQQLRERLEAGEMLVDLVRNEEPPRIVELLSTNMATLETAGAELRAAQALALRAEGLTIEDIAELFGVTRQRISALLKQKAAVAP
jgi:hypothetical protein